MRDKKHSKKIILISLSTFFITACNETNNAVNTSEDNSNQFASRSWSQLDPSLSSNFDFELRAIHFIDGEKIWAAGGFTNDGFSSKAGIIYSKDGGYTWSESDVYGDLWEIYGIHFFDNNKGWIVGNGDNKGLILNTSNGGKNWSQQTHSTGVLNTFYDVHFVNATHGWIIGGREDTNERVVLHTENGGDTWTEIYDFGSGLPFLSMSIVDQNNAWLVGMDVESDTGHSYYETTDGGTNWQTGKTGSYELAGLVAHSFDRVEFIDTSVGYVSSGSTVMKTIDGGLEWVRVFQLNDMDIKDMTFLNADIGWLVGSGRGGANDLGKIYFTSDGGESWTLEHISYDNNINNIDTALNAINALDINNVMTVGKRLTIFKRSENP
ncbi:YCF48-related protein [Salinispirillum sp. LH 10-3-1]|uniref:YCF48-related protein n=1 Tax=Salinispirillum sp. LH 10-3-1 TaxID=2952525 RepID=A0AB38YHV4_9GAMM